MIKGPNRPICSVRSAPNAEPAPPSCCRPATPKLCSFTSMRSQPKSLRALTLFSSSIKPAGMAPRPSRFQTTSRSCSSRHAHPNSTAKKISGNSCGRIGCQTGFSNPSTISLTIAATLGTYSSTNPGRLCPSRDATGQQSVTQSEDWYKTFLRWCVGRAILDQSPAEGVPLPAREVARDRVLNDQELAQVILAVRKIGGSYGGIVELLALTGQRREEVARLQWEELDLAQRVWRLPRSRTKNGKAHVVHLSEPSMAVLRRFDRRGPYVFSPVENKPFQKFSRAKSLLDQLSGVTGWRLHDLRRTCVLGMARLGVAPHVADKILNHQSGTISGVAAVYQRHEFIAERQAA